MYNFVYIIYSILNMSVRLKRIFHPEVQSYMSLLNMSTFIKLYQVFSHMLI